MSLENKHKSLISNRRTLYHLELARVVTDLFKYDRTQQIYHLSE